MSFFDDILPLALPAAILGSSLVGANAASNAAAAQVAGTDTAARTQLAMFQTNRDDLAPYRDTGTQSLFNLADLYGVPRPNGAGGYTAPGTFEGTPGYQFRVQQGVNALDRSAAARGKLLSGQQMKAISDYGQNTAAAEWGDYTNRLASLAGVGQTATTTTGNLGNAAATNIGNAAIGGANARASGYVGTANAVNSGVGNLLYLYGRQ